MTDTIESLRAKLAEVEGALREAMTKIPSQWGPSDVLAHLLRRAGERDQAVVRAEAAEASAGERALEIARLLTDVDQVVSDRNTALAACAEMRAALERIGTWDVDREAVLPQDEQIRRVALDVLARTDLGRGMVAVPREMLARVRDVARLLVNECGEQRECPVCGTDTNVDTCRPSCYVVKMQAALANLDTLADGGKNAGGGEATTSPGPHGDGDTTGASAVQSAAVAVPCSTQGLPLFTDEATDLQIERWRAFTEIHRQLGSEAFDALTCGELRQRIDALLDGGKGRG